MVRIKSKDGDIDLVEKVLKKVSKDMIAVSAFHCGAYNRALMYLEFKSQLVDQVCNAYPLTFPSSCCVYSCIILLTRTFLLYF